MLVERVLVWTGARVGGYSGELMLGWAGAWVDWVDGCSGGQAGGTWEGGCSVLGRTDDQEDGRTDGWPEAWEGGWSDGHMDGGLDGPTDGLANDEQMNRMEKADGADRWTGGWMMDR